MGVTEEEGGRLNAFAKEPPIEVINSNTSDSKALRLFLILGILLLVALIAYTFNMS